MKTFAAFLLAFAASSAHAVDFDWSVAGVYTDTSLESCSGDCAGLTDDKEIPVGGSVRAHLGLPVLDLGVMATFSNGPGAYLSLRSVVSGFDVSVGAGKQFMDTQVGLAGTLGTQVADSDVFADAYFARVAFGRVFVKYIAYDDTHSVSQRDVTGYDADDDPIFGGALAADYEIDRSEVWVGYTAPF